MNSVDEEEEVLAWLEVEVAKEDSLDTASSASKSEVLSMPTQLQDTSSCVDDNSDTYLAIELSAELLEENVKLPNVISLCNKLGKVPDSLRKQIWEALLHAKSQFLSNRPSRNFSPEEKEYINALIESALVRKGIIEDTLSNAEIANMKQDLLLLVPLWAHAKSLSIYSLDPGIVDVMLFMIDPSIYTSHDYIMRIIDALQLRHVTLLQGVDPEVADSMVANRSSLLKTLLRLHDFDLYATCFSDADFSASFPCRWWKSCFVGEVPHDAMLQILDAVVLDSCPENSGDTGPQQTTQTYGLLEGCDPRGPLNVYIILAVILRASGISTDQKVKLTDIVSTSCEILRSLSPNEARCLCQEALSLRRNTRIDVAFHRDNHGSGFADGKASMKSYISSYLNKRNRLFDIDISEMRHKWANEGIDSPLTTITIDSQPSGKMTLCHLEKEFNAYWNRFWSVPPYSQWFTVRYSVETF